MATNYNFCELLFCLKVASRPRNRTETRWAILLKASSPNLSNSTLFVCRTCVTLADSSTPVTKTSSAACTSWAALWECTLSPPLFLNLTRKRVSSSNLSCLLSTSAAIRLFFILGHEGWADLQCNWQGMLFILTLSFLNISSTLIRIGNPIDSSSTKSINLLVKNLKLLTLRINY